MKKSLLILIICMTLSMANIVPYAADKNISEERTVVEAVTDIKLGNDDEEITRAEFCKIVYNIKENTELESTTVIFSDVGLDFDYAGYIQNMYERGLISGDGSGNFRPDDKIVVSEAYAVLLKLAGYGDIVKNNSFPDGIVNIAYQLELSKNINAGANDAVTCEDVYKMIYNLLFTDVMLRGYDGIEYIKGKEFIEEVLKIYNNKGVVEAADTYSLYDYSYNENIAVISGVTLYNNGIVKADDVGIYGEYYYKENKGEYELVAFIPQKTSTIKLEAKDIDSYNDNVYTYCVDDKEKKAKLSPAKDIVYNNVQAKDETHMIPEYGYVVLIDNNDDGKYEVVFIYDYKNIYVTRVNTLNSTIAYSINSTDGTQRKELNLGAKDYTIYSEDGKEIKFSEIRANSVMTLQESEKDIKLYQSSDSIRGKITSITEDKYKYIVLDSTKMMITPTAFFDGWDGQTLTDVTVYFDMFNNVAAVVSKQESGWDFAFVMKSYFDQEKETVCLKLLCSDNEKKIIPIRSKSFRYDGVTSEVSELTTNLIGKGDVIRYKTNTNGEIIAVDMPVDKSSFDLTNRNTTSYDTFYKRSDGITLYKSYTNMFKSYGAMTLTGEAYLDSNTIVFNVPEDINGNNSDSDYNVVTKLSGDLICRTASYNIDSTSLKTNVIVVYSQGESKKLQNNARSMLIQNISRTVVDDEVRYLVKGLYNGAKTEKYVDESIEDSFQNLNPGDFIRVTIEGDTITCMQLLYSQNGESGILNRNYYYGVDTANSDLRVLIGNAVKIENDRMLFKFNGDKTEIFRPNSFKIYVYDKNLDNNNCCYIGKPEDILDITSNSVNYDTIILSTRATVGHDMLVIKK